MSALSSFEVLAESLLPKDVTPLTNVPFVLQAYFVQVSYLSSTGGDPFSLISPLRKLQTSTKV
jgi:hypothetical protein